MTDYKSYPSAVHASLLLKSNKMWPADSDVTGQALALEQAAIQAAGAAAEFERRTGWLPFLANLSGTVTSTGGSAVVTGTDTLLEAELEEGDVIDVGGEVRTVSSIADDTTLTVTEAFTTGAAGVKTWRVETRLYDATSMDGYLDLEAGIIGTPTIQIGGSTYTLDSQYYLRPSNARTQRLPYTALQFTTSIGGGQVYNRPNRISVTGRFGYCTKVPADVWAGILLYATVNTLMSIENTQSLASISMDGFSKGWDIVGIITPKDLLTTWPKGWEQLVRRYTRIVV